MREKQSNPKDGYPNMPSYHGKCVLCGKSAINYGQPIVCISHTNEPAECDNCPAQNCDQCKKYGKNIYYKIKCGGWRP
jgi:hypothetical protein